jgi:hypothetical protein
MMLPRLVWPLAAQGLEDIRTRGKAVRCAPRLDGKATVGWRWTGIPVHVGRTPGRGKGRALAAYPYLARNWVASSLSFSPAVHSLARLLSSSITAVSQSTILSSSQSSTCHQERNLSVTHCSFDLHQYYAHPLRLHASRLVPGTVP